MNEGLPLIAVSAAPMPASTSQRGRSGEQKRIVPHHNARASTHDRQESSCIVLDGRTRMVAVYEQYVGPVEKRRYIERATIAEDVADLWILVRKDAVAQQRTSCQRPTKAGGRPRGRESVTTSDASSATAMALSPRNVPISKYRHLGRLRARPRQRSKSRTVDVSSRNEKVSSLPRSSPTTASIGTALGRSPNSSRASASYRRSSSSGRAIVRRASSRGLRMTRAAPRAMALHDASFSPQKERWCGWTECRHVVRCEGWLETVACAIHFGRLQCAYDHDSIRSSMSDHTAPIFVLGCGRSGTTLLRLMLNSHPRISIPGETWYFPTSGPNEVPSMPGPESEWRDRLTQKIVGSSGISRTWDSRASRCAPARVAHAL